MPITLDWIHPDRVLHMHFLGDVTIDELQDAADEVTRLLDAAGNRITIMADGRELTGLPHSVPKIVRAVRHPLTHQNIDWFISYGIQLKTVRFLVLMVMKILSARFHYYDTQEEAFQLMEQVTIVPIQQPQLD